MEIKLFATGGTFDKEYNEIHGELFFTQTHLAELLQLGRCGLSIDVETLMLIDSLDMTEKERAGIVTHCLRTPEKKIVITHGTDTMVQTAKLIAKSIKDKTVVLTGAMIPYKFGGSDAIFNLGSALSFVQVLPVGVYIAMHGKYFSWDNVRKNTSIAEFEEIL
jgi:L-asparaginase